MNRIKRSLNIGDKFGYWTVISDRFYNEKTKRWYYTCQCRCGKTTNQQAKSFYRKNPPKSCGCGERAGGEKRSKDKNTSWKGYGEIGGRYWKSINKHAQSKNREFNITLPYIWELFLKQNRKCIYTGQILVFATWDDKFEQTASLDRIDSSQGYTEGNVQWIHKDINTVKSNWTEEKFLLLCRLVVSHMGG